MPLPENFNENNLLGNVLTVIRDREPTDTEPTDQEFKSIEDVVQRFADRWGDGDFDKAESAFWDEQGGPLCDEVMAVMRLEF
jgi:hypothetical protein